MVVLLIFYIPHHFSYIHFSPYVAFIEYELLNSLEGDFARSLSKWLYW